MIVTTFSTHQSARFFFRQDISLRLQSRRNVLSKKLVDWWVENIVTIRCSIVFSSIVPRLRIRSIDYPTWISHDKLSSAGRISAWLSIQASLSKQKTVDLRRLMQEARKHAQQLLRTAALTTLSSQQVPNAAELLHDLATTGPSLLRRLGCCPHRRRCLRLQPSTVVVLHKVVKNGVIVQKRKDPQLLNRGSCWGKWS